MLVGVAWRMIRWQPGYTALNKWAPVLNSPTPNPAAKKKAVVIERQLAVDLCRVFTGHVEAEKFGLVYLLAQRGGIQTVVLNPFAAFISVLGLYHEVLDAEFLEPAVQKEFEGARFITGHDFVRELLLFDYEQK
jgi:hypothetical protein